MVRVGASRFPPRHLLQLMPDPSQGSALSTTYGTPTVLIHATAVDLSYYSRNWGLLQYIDICTLRVDILVSI